MNIGIIPARLASKRFPKKILADLNGKPLVAHTIERAQKAKKLDRVLLAIDSEETKSALENYDFDIIMTSQSHSSGTDRIAEVMEEIHDAEIIINIQADEPLIDPYVIDSLVDSFEDESVRMSTVVSTKLTVSDLLNPNVVKAIIDEKRNAVEFKRNIFDVEIGGVYRHVGAYGFCRETLIQYYNLAPSDRELRTSLEQLRALDNNIPIRAVITDYASVSVDILDDLAKVLKIIENSEKNLIDEKT